MFIHLDYYGMRLSNLFLLWQYTIEIRLDRALVSNQWLILHKEATLLNMKVTTSDHMPIFLELSQDARPGNSRHFRFENAWLREPKCKEIVTDCWLTNSALDYDQKISICQKKLGLWGKEITGNFAQRIRQCKHRLKHLKQRRVSHSVQMYIEEQKIFNEILIQKEIFWRQRSK